MTDEFTNDNKAELLHKYVMDHSLRLRPTQEKLIEATRSVPHFVKLSSADQIQLLQNIVIAMGGKRAIDVGTFTGYSALSIAMVLPPGGKLYTFDIKDTHLPIARDAWKEAGVDNIIEFQLGSAVDTMKNLLDAGEAGTFDFVFVDADKNGYEDYFELALQLLRPGGLVAFDNVLWFGTVADTQSDEEIAVILRKFNAKVVKDTRVNISMLTTGDGITLCFKK